MRALLLGIFNAGLRGATLASKFLLALYLARYLAPEDLGLYGMISATLVLALQILGLDFYAYSARELLAREPDQRSRLIRDQLVFHALTYPLFLPVLLLPFALGLLPWPVAGWCLVLVVLEHLSTEAYRVLVMLSRPMLANTALFLRAGAWIYAVGTVGILWPTARDLTWVWAGWVFGNLMGLGLAAGVLSRLPWRGVGRQAVDWRWLRRGLRVGSHLFIGSVALASVTYLDRYVIQYFRGQAEVGYYTFFWGIASVIHVFVYNTATVWLYPRLVAAQQRGDHSRAAALIRRLWGASALASVPVALAIVVGISPLMRLLDRPDYLEHLPAFWLLVAFQLVTVLADVPHFALYARGLDRQIVICHGVCFAVAAVMAFALIPTLGLTGAALAALISRTAMLGLRLFFALRSRASGRRAVEIELPSEVDS